MKEITKDSNLFKKTDEAILVLTKRLIKNFNCLNSSLSALKFDEINVMASQTIINNVSATFNKNDKEIKFYLFFLYWYMYNFVMEEDKICRKEAEQKVLQYLEEPNQVTKYIYADEYNRKKARLTENLLADIVTSNVVHSSQIRKDIKKTESYVARQAKQYADLVTLQGVYDAYKAAGVSKVMWVSQRDKKVCGECAGLDGRIFSIGNVPPPVHQNCRCFTIPLRRENPRF